MAEPHYGRCEHVDSCGYDERPPYEPPKAKEWNGQLAQQERVLPRRVFDTKAAEVLESHPNERSVFDRITYGYWREVFPDLDEGASIEQFNALQVSMGITIQNKVCAVKGVPGTAFWCIDEHGGVCDGQFKDFGEGLRTYKHEGKAIMNWAYSVLKANGRVAGHLKAPPRMFGLHRLKAAVGKTIHIYESPKTAFLMTLWAMKMQQEQGLPIEPPICLSVMSIHGLGWLTNKDYKHRHASLHAVFKKQKQFILHPDLKAEAEWIKHVDALEATYGGHWIVDRSLRRKASDEQIKSGLDWGDFVFGSKTPLRVDGLLMCAGAWRQRAAVVPVAPPPVAVADADPFLEQLAFEPDIWPEDLEFEQECVDLQYDKAAPMCRAMDMIYANHLNGLYAKRERPEWLKGLKFYGPKDRPPIQSKDLEWHVKCLPKKEFEAKVREAYQHSKYAKQIETAIAWGLKNWDANYATL